MPQSQRTGVVGGPGRVLQVVSRIERHAHTKNCARGVAWSVRMLAAQGTGIRIRDDDTVNRAEKRVYISAIPISDRTVRYRRCPLKFVTMICYLASFCCSGPITRLERLRKRARCKVGQPTNSTGLQTVPARVEAIEILTISRRSSYE